MKLGVAGMVPGGPRHVGAGGRERGRSAGFCGCSLFLPTAEEVSQAEVDRLRAAFGRARLRVAQVNARYPDLVHPAEPLRRAGIARLQAAVHVGAALGAGTVYVRPGSLNP